jgi:hypothetical protein
MNQNNVTEMMPSGTFGMFPSFCPQCTDFGQFWGNFGNTANTSQGNQLIGNILNVFAVFPKFPRNLPKLVLCGRNDGDIPNVPLGIISVTLFWFILNFTDSVHCDPLWEARTLMKSTLIHVAETVTGSVCPRTNDQ